MKNNRFEIIFNDINFISDIKHSKIDNNIKFDEDYHTYKYFDEYLMIRINPIVLQDIINNIKRVDNLHNQFIYESLIQVAYISKINKNRKINITGDTWASVSQKHILKYTNKNYLNYKEFSLNYNHMEVMEGVKKILIVKCGSLLDIGLGEMYGVNEEYKEEYEEEYYSRGGSCKEYRYNLLPDKNDPIIIMKLTKRKRIMKEESEDEFDNVLASNDNTNKPKKVRYNKITIPLISWDDMCEETDKLKKEQLKYEILENSAV